MYTNSLKRQRHRITLLILAISILAVALMANATELIQSTKVNIFVPSTPSEPVQPLSEEEKAEAIEIALNDSSVQKLLEASGYEILKVEAAEKLESSCGGQRCAIVSIYNHSDRKRIVVEVNLEAKKVDWFGVYPEPPPLEDDIGTLKARAVQIALEDAQVQEFIGGRPYNASAKSQIHWDKPDHPCIEGGHLCWAVVVKVSDSAQGIITVVVTVDMEEERVIGELWFPS